MGSYQHLPARNCWIARVYDPTRPGKARSRTFAKGVTSKREAARLSVDVIADLQREVDEAALNMGTVKEYVDKWLDRRRAHLSPTTIAGGYEVICKRIVRKFGKRPIRELGRAEIRDWYDELRRQTKPEKLSERTIERHHQVLRAILYEAVDDEVIPRNPIQKLKRPSIEHTELQIPTAPSVALAMGLPGDFGRFVRLLIATGLRRGELLGLAWADIVEAPPIDGQPSKTLRVRRAVLEAKGNVTLGPTKSKRGRDVRIGPDAIAVLEEQARAVLAQVRDSSRAIGTASPDSSRPIGLHPSAPVFPDLGKDRTGMTPHRPSWASGWWRRVRDDIGMSGVRLHSLRHYHATSLLDQGVPLVSVSKRLGHSKPSTTSDIYGHATDEGEQRAVLASKLPELPAPQ